MVQKFIIQSITIYEIINVIIFDVIHKHSYYLCSGSTDFFMYKALRDIAQVRLGYFAPTTTNDGGIPYLQVKQFDETGNLIAPPDTFLNYDHKVTSQMLKHGDVIFAGKGSKNFAWCYKNHFGEAVASTTFFVITPHRGEVLPEYLAAIFNHSSGQAHFNQLGLGSNIKSIRKGELEDMKIPVPTLAQQAKVADIANLQREDNKLTRKLMQKKNERYDSIIKLLTEI